ncbi:MAG: TonB-dependent receptor, partial [bacterium]|nr:TonB-dependent receptor [bacterium]
NVATAPNADLEPESLFGAEAGLDLIGETRRLSLTAYRNELKDLISNVTLSVTPNLINRQRQNAGTAVARGVETEVRQRWRAITATAAYLYVDSRFESGPRVPQVPKHQGSAQLTYNRGGTLLSGGLRSYSFQFEDDRNQFALPGYPVLHVQFLQRLAGRLSAVASIENALNREFVVGFSPTPRIGAPRLWRIGLRWH